MSSSKGPIVVNDDEGGRNWDDRKGSLDQVEYD